MSGRSLGLGVRGEGASRCAAAPILFVLLQSAGSLDRREFETAQAQGLTYGRRTAIGQQPALGLEQGTQGTEKFNAPELGAATGRERIHQHQIELPFLLLDQRLHCQPGVSPDHACAAAEFLKPRHRAGLPLCAEGRARQGLGQGFAVELESPPVQFQPLVCAGLNQRSGVAAGTDADIQDLKVAARAQALQPRGFDEFLACFR